MTKRLKCLDDDKMSLKLYRKGDDEVLIVENKTCQSKIKTRNSDKLAHEGHQGIVRTKQLFREISDYCK